MKKIKKTFLLREDTLCRLFYLENILNKGEVPLNQNDLIDALVGTYILKIERARQRLTQAEKSKLTPVTRDCSLEKTE